MLKLNEYCPVRLNKRPSPASEVLSFEVADEGKS